MRIAEQNLESAFLASTPGKKTASLAEQNRKLQAQLDDVLDAYHSKPPPSAPLVPALARCPSCQGTALVRNGRVRTQRQGLRQRLWCRACNISVYVDVKKLSNHPRRLHPHTPRHPSRAAFAVRSLLRHRPL